MDVDVARNGAEAVRMVERADEGAYRMVFMDIQMPVMDGYAATRATRALPDPLRASLPIIAVSANAFSEDRKRSLELRYGRAPSQAARRAPSSVPHREGRSLRYARRGRPWSPCFVVRRCSACRGLTKVSPYGEGVRLPPQGA